MKIILSKRNDLQLQTSMLHQVVKGFSYHDMAGFARNYVYAFLLLLCTFYLGNLAQAQTPGSLDLTFGGNGASTEANGEVLESALQSNGKVIIVGKFTSYNGVPRNRIARINSDGSLDLSFNPGSGAGGGTQITTVAIQADGKILIGGDFLSFNGTASKSLARLNENGTLDASFNVGTSVFGYVHSIIVQPDGKVLIGGQFSQYNGISRNGIARLNSNGTLDTSFDPGSGVASDHPFTGPASSVGGVYRIAIQPDGKIMIVGYFNAFNGVVRNRIARLNSNGSLDASFDPGSGASDSVHAIAIQTDGKIIVGGAFYAFNGLGKRLIRLNSNGTLDNSFDVGYGPSSQVDRIVLQSDSKILIGGKFTFYDFNQSRYIARVNSDGSFDSTFNIGFGSSDYVYTMNVQADGKIIVGGRFNYFGNYTKSRLLRLNSDGSVDIDYPSDGANSTISVMVKQPDGKIIIGGNFTSYNGISRNRIARLDQDGNLDLSFNYQGNLQNVIKIALQSNGKIIVLFSNALLRLNTDGSLDETFEDVGFTSGTLNDLLILPDDKILVGGASAIYWTFSANKLIRLNADGSIDNTFNSAVIDTYAYYMSIVISIAIQTDGKIIVAGGTGGSYLKILRLNQDGSIDTSFNLGNIVSGGWIYKIVLQPDDKIIAVGNFLATQGSISSRGIARFLPNGNLDPTFNVAGVASNHTIHSCVIQSNDKVIVGGNFNSFNGININRIARINPDGTLDEEFNPEVGPNSLIYDLLIQPDGNVIIGGAFTQYAGVDRKRIARIFGGGYEDACEVNIPDLNFKTALLANAMINTNADDKISCEEAEAFSGSLNVSNLGINDLTGIQSFTNITELNCSMNNLTSLDVSSNTELISLECGANILYDLDVTNNTALQTLQLSANQVSALNVTNNTSLTYLHCGGNILTALDVTSNTQLTSLECWGNQISTLNLANNNQLTQLYCSDNNLSTLNVSGNALLQYLYCDGNNISSLDLSLLTSLEWLRCFNNELIFLNIKNGNNSNLSTFEATGNTSSLCIQVDDSDFMNTTWSSGKDLTASYEEVCNCVVNIPDANFKNALLSNLSINTNNDDEIQCEEAEAYSGAINVAYQSINSLTGIEAFVNITSLDCSHNSLTTLDVSANTALTELIFLFNNVITIDLSQNANLEYLDCQGNLLTDLNVSNNTALKFLYCAGYGTITTLDLSANTALIQFGAGEDPISNIILGNHPYLTHFYCTSTLLNSINLSNCPELQYLDVSNNPISYLDVTANTKLIELTCSNTQLVSLDLSFNHDLTILISENAFVLNSINLKNGNNENINTLLIAAGTPMLTCVEVDDVDFMNDNWGWALLPHTSFSLACEENCIVPIPDSILKNALVTNPAINTNYDGEIDCMEASVYNGIIDISGLGISSMTGIEAFENITELYCSNNQIDFLEPGWNSALEILDCSNNMIDVLGLTYNDHLRELHCSFNALVYLDIAFVPSLEVIDIGFNSIGGIDLNGVENLEELNVQGCAISELNLTNVPLLQNLNVDFNPIQVLSLENNLQLETLDCSFTELTSLNLELNSNLTSLNCSNANLEFLNIANGNNSDLINFNPSSNPMLTCIEVDDIAFMNDNWGFVLDPQMSFSLNCGEPEITWYLDADSDGWYNGVYVSDESPGNGWVNILPLGGEGDCDDNDGSVWNWAVLFIDNDGDGYTAGTQQICYGSTLPAGYTFLSSGSDCNDSNANINPGASELCGNGLDDNCNGSTDEGCNTPPPSNNNPAPNNPSLNTANFVYPNCLQIQGSTLGATASSYTGQRDVWYQFNALTNGVSIKVSSSAINAKVFLFRSDNLGVILSEEDLVVGTGTEVLNFGGLEAGVSYRIAVAAMGSNDGAFSLCIQQLKKPTCASNGVLGLCSAFQSSWTSATSTTFSFTQGATTTSVTSAFPIVLSNPALQLQYGNSYDVGITANYVLQNGLGQNETIQVPNANACSITISNQPQVVVKTNQRCPATLFRLNYLQGELIGAGNICGLTGYRVEFTPVNNCNGDNPQNLQTFTRDINGTAANISLSYAFNHIPLFGFFNIGYWKVRWAPKFGSTVGTYGNPHIIAVNGTGAAGMTLLEQSDMIAPIVEISANLYPNPNSGDMVNLNLTGIEKGDVFVRILDGMGRVVYNNRYVVEGSLNTIVSFNKSLASGIYMVEFNTGDEIITQRMMVNK